jgi:hypothetical protein
VIEQFREQLMGEAFFALPLFPIVAQVSGCARDALSASASQR